MLWTVFQCWQTNQAIWEPSSKYCFVLSYPVNVQSKTFFRCMQSFFSSLVLDVFICITCLMDELKLLGPINQCLPCMPLVTCSWVKWLTPLHLSVHQYLWSAQPVGHFLCSPVEHNLIQPENFVVKTNKQTNKVIYGLRSQRVS